MLRGSCGLPYPLERRAAARAWRADCARSRPRTRVRRPSRAAGTWGRAREARREVPTGAVEAAASAKTRLTRRSSSDWYDMTTMRPPTASTSSAAGIARLEHRQLGIDLDAQRLEHALGGVPRPLRGIRRRSDEDLDQAARPVDRPLGACRDDGPRVAARELLLAVPLEDAPQLSFAVGREDVGGGHAGRLVHAHVEGRILRVRESAVGDVELQRRDAEVEQDAVDLLQSGWRRPPRRCRRRPCARG